MKKGDAGNTMDAGNDDPGALRRRVSDLEAVLHHRERQIEAMRRTSEALFSHIHVDALIRQTLDLALDVLHAEAGTLYLHQPADDTLVFRYVVGPAAQSLIGQSIPAASGIAGHCFQTGAPSLTRRAHEHEKFNQAVDAASGFRTDSLMTVAVKRSDGAPVGVVWNCPVPPGTRLRVIGGGGGLLL